MATVKRMRAFIVGQVKDEAGSYTAEEGWKPFMPPVQMIGKGWEVLAEILWEQVASWKDGPSLAGRVQLWQNQHRSTSSECTRLRSLRLLEWFRLSSMLSYQKTIENCKIG